MVSIVVTVSPTTHTHTGTLHPTFIQQVYTKHLHQALHQGQREMYIVRAGRGFKDHLAQHLAFKDRETETQSHSQDHAAKPGLNPGSHCSAPCSFCPTLCLSAIPSPPANLPPDNLFCPENSAVRVRTVVGALGASACLNQ